MFSLRRSHIKKMVLILALMLCLARLVLSPGIEQLIVLLMALASWLTVPCQTADATDIKPQ